MLKPRPFRDHRVRQSKMHITFHLPSIPVRISSYLTTFERLLRILNVTVTCECCTSRKKGKKSKVCDLLKT